ncbi:alpha/beta hydrolase family protein [Algoriphagus machipongonensis]|uniref:Probable acylaminoacyl-peptidase n=1 Tax=Algoriphagus machipongonensis TaxID=388413 RepID=A3I1W0_9BACT|nr:prolyl oligopeptidase family serine peptidase [Algoriphagus machipongonensis]EAZ79776.1 probable acylaminoacyl-peptidase [Algoriphagus machipongonensis]
MLRKLGLAYFVAFALLLTHVEAQQKRSLNHSDYDGWESLRSERITKNGQWVLYQIAPQEGDGRVEILPYDSPNNKFIVPRASSVQFTPDDAFAVGKILPEEDTVRMLKLKKAKKDEMPSDSLFIYEMSSGELEKFPKVKSFDTPSEKGSWIAIHFEKEKPKKKEEADSTAKAEKPKKTDGTKLLVRSLDGSKSYEFERVKSFGFAPNGDFLQFVLAEEDTLDNASIHILDLESGEDKLIHEGMTSYKSNRFSPQSKYLAFLTSDDSAKAEKPYYQLQLYDVQSGSLKQLADESTEGILAEGRISENGSLKFSENENRLFFGTAPEYVDYPYEKDTTILDDERPSLDIWGWQDDDIQPMQLKQKSREESRSYLATIDLASGKVAQLETQDLEDVRLENKVTKEFGLGTSNAPYKRNYSWDIQIGRDIYLVDFNDGSRKLIEKEASGYPSISPAGKYVYWYASRDSAWVAYDISAEKRIELTKDLEIDFFDELHDSPSLPGGYGNGGWLDEDEAILIYDRFDIWKIDPKNPSGAVSITGGTGRSSNTVFRVENLDRDILSIDPDSPVILSAFNEMNKESGFYSTFVKSSSSPEKLIMTPNRYYSLNKAKNSDHATIRRMTYVENPDLYLTGLEFKSLEKVSNLNPQQSSINWGTAELVSYNTTDGDPLQGILFKPENFDPNKKYPMMVYFYERSSDGLYSYRTPAPSASTINIPYFVSNEYLVFVPDIKYELGLPGPSAFNCIIPGVQAVVSKGFVDEDNMAIQGQSWGGYQVAYLITQTNMFKAAGAGAPVVNMTSAYGGIRWGTGMSRMFQYEQTQSRIGGTLWQKPLYYIENSPLFFMDRVNTPVLIMHNDEDGAVPWYQGIEMFMALKRLDKPAWLLQYNGEDHNLRQRRNRKDLSMRLSQFFDHYLKGAPAPLWMTEGLPAVEKGKTLKYELSN